MRSPFDEQAKLAFVVAALALVVAGVGFKAAVRHLNVVLRKEPVDLRARLDGLPKTLGDWRTEGADQALDAAMVEALGTDKYLNRIYVRRADGEEREVMLHVAYYTGMVDAVPHIPDRCFVAGGWDQISRPRNHTLALAYPSARPDPGPVHRSSGDPYRIVRVPHPITGRLESVRLPLGGYSLRVAEFAFQDAENVRLHGGYFFIANHRLTPSPEYIRSLAFRPSERFAYYVKVQLTLLAENGEDEQEFIELSTDLLQPLIPYMMRCLPDWSEVESAARVPSESEPVE